MITHRAHFQRMIQGTATREFQQVLFSPGEDGSGSFKVDRWTKSGGTTSHKVTHLEALNSDLVAEAESNVRSMIEGGWEQSYQSTFDSSMDEKDLVLFKIDAQVDLVPDVEAIAASMFEVDLRVDKAGSFMAGPHPIDMKRTRRRPGEERELRYDCIAAQVPYDSIAAKVLVLLSKKHGGKLMDELGVSIDQEAFIGSIELDSSLDPLIEHLGLVIPKRARPVHWTSPWGQRIQPAVF